VAEKGLAAVKKGGKIMSKVAIVGVGDVGATLAYTIQMQGLATEIVLVDNDGERAEANALDMNHGLFFTPPVSIHSGSYPDCKESDLLVIAAGARRKPGETRLDLTSRNARIVREILGELKLYVGTAKMLIITNPVDVMTKVAVENSGLPVYRVFGSGTVLDSARFRFELSRRCRVDPRNVHAYVIGEHGDSEVFLWSQVHMGGTPLEALCRDCEHSCTAGERSSLEEKVRASGYHIIEKKGYTNYGVSLAVSRIIGATLRDERSLLTVSTFMEGAYGLTGICLSVPCIVGARGIERIIETPLSDKETENLKASAKIVASRAVSSG
jgi:L-lactate dehydrogenase